MLYGVTVRPSQDAFESATPAQVLAGIYNLRTESGISFDVERKGERFLMVRLSGDATEAQSLRVIVKRARELDRR